MRASETNPFSYYDAKGNDNPEWKGKPVTEMLTAVLGSDQSAEVKARAVTILKFCVEREKEAEGQPEIDRTVAGMLTRGDAHALWEWPDSFIIEKVTGEDGITRQRAQRIKVTSETLPTPVLTPPKPEPSGLAVPAPVIPPSTEELAARSAYKPRTQEQIAANVEAIVADANELKLKSQTPVEQVEQQMESRKDLLVQIAANEKLLAELRAKRDADGTV